MDGEARVAGWTIFGVLCAFKLLTAVLIFTMMPSAGTALLLIIFHWFWVVPLVVFGVAALIGWLRLVRVRARRAHLVRTEFSAD